MLEQLAGCQFGCAAFGAADDRGTAGLPWAHAVCASRALPSFARVTSQAPGSSLGLLQGSNDACNAAVSRQHRRAQSWAVGAGAQEGIASRMQRKVQSQEVEKLRIAKSEECAEDT